MAKKYKLSFGRKFLNWSSGLLAKLGFGQSVTYNLTVVGRKSGKPRTTPVNVVELDGERWLVSPYGERQWVRNARVAGKVTLSRRSTSETVSLEEEGSGIAAPVLQKYFADTPITRPYFDLTEESSLAAFPDEAPNHPVFRIVAANGD